MKSAHCPYCQTWREVLTILGADPAQVAAHSLKRSHMKHNVVVRRRKALIHMGRRA